MKKALFIVFFLTTAAFGQASRFDNAAQTTLAGGVVITSPLAVVTACNFPATVIAGQACTNKAPICPGITGVGCSTTGNPVTADSQGNFGFWLLPGAYDYTVCPVGGTCSSPVHLVISPTTASNVTWTGTHSFSTPPTFTGPLGIASGGTNNSTGYTTNSIFYFDGTRFVSIPAPGIGTFCVQKTSSGIPFYGSCNGTATGTPLVSSCGSAALTGAIRLCDGDIINWRSNDGLSDINGISKDTLNKLIIGGISGIKTNGGIQILGGNTLSLTNGANSTVLNGNPGGNGVSLGDNILGSQGTGNTLMGSRIGASSGGAIGQDNTSVGNFSSNSNNGGNQNVALGVFALANNTSGSTNIAIGYQAGTFLTSTESNNIDIGNTGSLGESNIVRLGTPGTHTQTFLSGKVTLDTSAFASLGTPVNGTIIFCNNCTIANPCAGGGTGALAKRLNGVWVCN